MVLPRPSTPGGAPLGDLAVLAGAELHGPAGTTVAGVTLDSRSVREGDLYAALPGAHTHGASFAAQARARGARAVLTDGDGAARLADAGVSLPLLLHPGPRSVLGDVAARIYGTQHLPLRMVGVTGTNGKTTTAYLLCGALEALGRRTGLIGTVETRIGDERVPSARTTPESPDLHALLALMAERAVDTCVMEVSSHALTLHRVDGVVYDLALFTNLSQDHLDFHEDMDAYFAAKASLFTSERSRAGLACVDDEWGRRLAREAAVPVQTLTSRSDTAADWVVARGEGDPLSFVLTGPGGIAIDLRSALPGGFNVVNTAMAAAALVHAGASADEAASAVLADPHVPGRMEQVTPSRPDGRAPLAVVDYAHTPDAVAAALAALRPGTAGRLVVVLGAGGDRDTGKRHGMGAAAAAAADIVVVTDDNPRSEDPAAIRRAVLDGARASERAVEIVEVAARQEAIREGVARAVAAGPGSTVAVVGKGHESGQDVDGVIHPFDDRAELRAALDDVLKEGSR